MSGPLSSRRRMRGIAQTDQATGGLYRRLEMVYALDSSDIASGAST